MKYIALNPHIATGLRVSGLVAILILQQWINARLNEARIAGAAKIEAENINLQDQMSAITQRITAIDDHLKELSSEARDVDQNTAAIVDEVLDHTGLAPRAHEILGKAAEVAPNAAALAPFGAKDASDFASLIDTIGRIELHAAGLTSRVAELELAVEQRTEFLASVPAIKPAEGRISSHFGNRVSPISGRKGLHKGLDIAANVGTPVYAPADGQVRYSGRFGGFGNYISIVHGHDLVTKFAHLDSLKVKKGEQVTRGQLIGFTGQTGRSTGPHLHYEVWSDNEPVDPAGFLFASDAQPSQALAANHASNSPVAP